MSIEALNLKDLYDNNEKFHEYVTRYIRDNALTLEQGFRHKVIINYARYVIDPDAKEV